MDYFKCVGIIGFNLWGGQKEQKIRDHIVFNGLRPVTWLRNIDFKSSR